MEIMFGKRIIGILTPRFSIKGVDCYELSAIKVICYGFMKFMAQRLKSRIYFSNG